MAERVMVVAHPDDEILWLSSAMAVVDSIVFCFGAPYGRPRKAANRARAVAHLGLPHVTNLALPESGARLQVNWQNPQLTATGIAISNQEAQQRYDANFLILLEKLRPVLSGAADVYTHNPWGEYGHSEHIQVYRAVKALQDEQGFTIWFSNYAAPQTYALAKYIGRARFWQQKRNQSPDVKIAHRLRKIYQKYGAWTWSFLHKWPAMETLYAQPHGSTEKWFGLSGEQLYNARRLRLWCPVWAAIWCVK